MADNVRLYPWFQFCRNLLFWQAIWFLYFQKELSAAEAILLAAIYDIATTAVEIPSGYLSDRIGRRPTLIIATVVYFAAALLLAFGETFVVFAIAQLLLGTAMACVSGTDTSLLYETLKSEGREQAIDVQEQRSWRFSFAGLALSAASGGLIASIAPMYAFLASAGAAAAALWIATRFTEPAHIAPPAHVHVAPATDPRRHLAALRSTLKNPTLAWIFVLYVAMYTFSHVPFVFGQPFILEALKTAGTTSDASLISGFVVSLMMLISVATSWLAAPLRRRLGVGAVFLMAFGMQITLIALLASTNHPIAIALLLLRMVPDSHARPFILAHLHPLLESSHRATYLSLQSLCARLLFATTLFLSSSGAASDAGLAYEDMRLILIAYATTGFCTWLALLWGLNRADLPPAATRAPVSDRT